METITKINKTKSWLFEKLKKKKKKKGKSLAKLIEKKRRLNKIRNEKEVTTDKADIQRIIRGHYEQSYANKTDNVQEMDKILEKYNLPNWTKKSRKHEQTNHKHGN